ncbi:RNA cap guanine-N2 methyltransferase-domain-containing protein [Scheffersomyces xylosifermentans]|uniref:RNA cap guanine-N2 methyltransferase-domain-containing protein n=1 Tax=Scheffersomyces xylosifermentans TaxID=1304137 RepID=UPI00315D4997
MHNYTTLPDECKKFWKKRYRLFSKFDEGIYMTSELWYSVTPESIAIFVARLFSYLIPEAKCAVDLCCGGGGNTIQFAKYFKSTIGIDINPTNVQCTEHNAQIYGVGENIFTVVGDWNEMSKVNDNGSKTFDFIFSSPPWGGPAYTKKGQEFDLHTMEPFPIERLIQQCLQYTENIGLFLPKSSNLSQISQATKKFFGNEGSCRVIYINSTGYCVGMLALMGPKVTGELDYDQFFSTEFGEE